MAQDFNIKPGVTTVGASSYETIKWFKVCAAGTPGNADTGFSGFVLELNTAGTLTPVYFWINTSGMLRYGTTAPTVATQNSAGTAIGS